MKFFELGQLSLKHLRSAWGEYWFLKGKGKAPKPTLFYATFNERCNARCRMCHHWRKEKYSQEMTIEQWKKALMSIKRFVGTYAVHFSGGEPFIKPGILDLFAFLNQNKIKVGVVTNGSMLVHKHIADKFVATRPMNLNISLDAKEPGLHDYICGREGLHQKVTTALELILAAQKEQKVDFPVIMKVTVSALNFRQLPEQLKWARKLGFSGASLQPVEPWTKEAQEEFMPEKKDLADFRRVVEELVALKKQGFPMLNSIESLELMIDYFFGPRADRKKNPGKKKKSGPCRVSLRNFKIHVNGSVSFCSFFPNVGNLQEESAEAIWYGKKAQEVREQTLKCQRLCLLTCYSRKTLKDKASMVWKLFIRK